MEIGWLVPEKKIFEVSYEREDHHIMRADYFFYETAENCSENGEIFKTRCLGNEFAHFHQKFNQTCAMELKSR